VNTSPPSANYVRPWVPKYFKTLPQITSPSLSGQYRVRFRQQCGHPSIPLERCGPESVSRMVWRRGRSFPLSTEPGCPCVSPIFLNHQVYSPPKPVLILHSTTVLKTVSKAP
jgi:hypothetical protein